MAIFIVFSFVCLLFTEEFQRMLTVDVLMVFNRYVLGGGTILSTGIVGVLLLLAGKKDSMVVLNRQL